MGTKWGGGLPPLMPCRAVLSRRSLKTCNVCRSLLKTTDEHRFTRIKQNRFAAWKRHETPIQSGNREDYHRSRLEWERIVLYPTPSVFICVHPWLKHCFYLRKSVDQKPSHPSRGGRAQALRAKSASTLQCFNVSNTSQWLRCVSERGVCRRSSADDCAGC